MKTGKKIFLWLIVLVLFLSLTLISHASDKKGIGIADLKAKEKIYILNVNGIILGNLIQLKELTKILSLSQ